MHSIASTIAVVGFAVSAQAFPAFRGQVASSRNSNNAVYSMFHHASPSVFDQSPLFRIEEESVEGIQAEDKTPEETKTVDDEETTTGPIDDEDMITTTGPLDDDETTTAAPDTDNEEAADSEAYILSDSSDSSRNLQAEVVGILPPLVPLPGVPLPILPGVVIVDVDGTDEEVTTEAPVDVTTEPVDEDITTADPEESIPTVLPGGPIKVIVDLLRPTPRGSTVEPTTVAATEKPAEVTEPAEPVGVEPTEEPKEEPQEAVEPVEDNDNKEEPSDDSDNSEDSTENVWSRFLPSWLRSA